MVRTKRVTISDVAKVAGVSKQTVSRVINDRPDVSEPTRQLVRDAIAKLGYHPDPIARSMRGITQTIGCIVPDLTTYPVAQLIQAAQIELRKSHFSLLIECTPQNSDIRMVVDSLLSRRVDGFLIINPGDLLDYSYVHPVISQEVPIVYFGNIPPSKQLSSVTIDHQHGAYLATSYLLSLGHVSILLAMGERHKEDTLQKQAGFQQALLEVQQNIHSDLLFDGNGLSVLKYVSNQRSKKDDTGLTAVFAHSDEMALEIINALRSENLQVPQDISVIGYGDIPFITQFSPPLTSIQTPAEECGRSCAQLLTELISNPQKESKTIKIKPRLCLRESCLPKTMQNQNPEV